MIEEIVVLSGDFKLLKYDVFSGNERKNITNSGAFLRVLLRSFRYENT